MPDGPAPLGYAGAPWRHAAPTDGGRPGQVMRCHRQASPRAPARDPGKDALRSTPPSPSRPATTLAPRPTAPPPASAAHRLSTSATRRIPPWITEKEPSHDTQADHRPDQRSACGASGKPRPPPAPSPPRLGTLAPPPPPRRPRRDQRRRTVLPLHDEPATTAAPRDGQAGTSVTWWRPCLPLHGPDSVPGAAPRRSSSPPGGSSCRSARRPTPGCNSSSTSSARRRPSPPNTAASAPAASAPPSRRDTYQPVGLKAGVSADGADGAGRKTSRSWSSRAQDASHRPFGMISRTEAPGTAATATPSNGLDRETRGAG